MTVDILLQHFRMEHWPNETFGQYLARLGYAVVRTS